MRKALTVAAGVTVLTLAIYARLVTPEPVLIVHMAAHGVANTSTHLPLLIARATDSGAAWTLSSSDLTLGQGGDKPISEAYLTTLEILLTERLIATDDLAERTRLVDLIRASRAYRAKMVPEKVSHSASGLSTSTSSDSSASHAQRIVGPNSTGSGQGSSDNHVPLARDEAAALASTLDAMPTRSVSTDDLLNRARADLSSDNSKIFEALLWGVGYLLIIICGIYTGAVYEAIGSLDPQKPLKLRQVLRKAATAGAWQGLLASPIVFAVVMFVVPRGHFSFAMAFFAYQNGFFWRATLQKYAETRQVAQASRAVRTTGGETT